MIEVPNVKKAIAGIVNAVIGIGVVIIFFGSWFMVGPGVVGVTFNQMTGKTASYQQGFHFKLPLIIDVTKFDVKTQRIDVTAEGASKDLQLVKVEIVLNYHLDYTKVDDLFVKVGRDYKEKVIDPAINEVTKAAISQFPVEQIIVNREEVKKIIERLLAERLVSYNIILENINLMDIDFAPEFNKVVEEKQIEEQKIKTAQYQRMQAEENKKRTILDAEGEARKQQLLKETVSEKGVALQWIQKWDGKLPNIVAGDKGGLLLNIPNPKD